MPINPLNPLEQYREILSIALEDRSPGYQDLVSDNNALLAVMKAKGLWQEYSGPKIRERLLYNKTGSAVWYSGYDHLNPLPTELFNDAVYTPKMVAVAISLTNEEILNNEGENQIMDTLDAHMSAAEGELKDVMDEALHSDGTGFGGKELGGLRVAVPTTTNEGVYGGISRVDNALWRTFVYDAQTAFPTIGTQVASTTIRAMFNKIMSERSRGRQYPDLILASQEHYAAYDAATVAIQRITDTGTTLGKMGFPKLEFIGSGRRAEIVLESGIGSNMPANTTYFLNTDSLRVRYNKRRNFDKLFAGDGMMPINQDALVQYIGFMGELTQVNPLFNGKLIDSNVNA